MERFWSKIRIENSGCWIWTRATDYRGYGRVAYRGQNRQAHRVSWMLTNGDIPRGLNVLHKCDCRPCVNPAHLFLGTQRDNVQDMDKKKRRVSMVGEQSPNAVLTAHYIRIIRQSSASRISLAKRFGVHPGTISKVIHGVTWKHI